MDKHFPRNAVLAKVSNRSKVKLSYSCKSNFLNIIKRHNIRLLQGGKNCNWRDCPLCSKCQVEYAVYSAEPSDSKILMKHILVAHLRGEIKTIIPLLGSRSIEMQKLANCVCRLKEVNGRVSHIKWKIILKKAKKKKPGSVCKLC